MLEKFPHWQGPMDVKKKHPTIFEAEAISTLQEPEAVSPLLALDRPPFEGLLDKHLEPIEALSIFCS